ncbi:MAG TPA: sulfurtransferase, partial [Anaeromyxobacteraceae bacterium]|nr:sulfurtransferase [Anaeromyxobacteraceae bacterium]
MAHTTLVDGETLARHLGDPGWIVFDCRHELAAPARGRTEYLAAHVPGARFLHLDEDLSGPRTGRNGRHPLPDPEAFRATLQRAGVGDAAQVIAYDDQGGMVAARLWWMLRWMGHPAVAVLDGGWGRWRAEGRPTTTELPAPRPATLRGAPSPAATVDASFVLAHLGDPAVVVLDARGADRHRGENETIDPVAGRIPGSRNRPWAENLTPDGRFKPAAALARELAEVLRGAAPVQVVASCGSGVSACHDLLAMEVAGLGGARLYPGS